jgi:hypothetical protein
MSHNPYPQPDGYTSLWSASYSPAQRTLRIFCDRQAIDLCRPTLATIHEIHDADRIEFWSEGQLQLVSPEAPTPISAEDWHLEVDVLFNPDTRICRVVVDRPALADSVWVQGRDRYRDLVGAERLEIWSRETLLTELPLHQEG